MKKIPVMRVMPLIAGVALIFILQACTFSDSGLKKSIGTVNELLIVTNDKLQWEGELGDTLRAVFAAEMPALTQPEPIFDLVNVADEDFSMLFQKYHNIFIVDIDPKYAGARSETTLNQFAQPQRVIRVTAPDLSSFVSELYQKKESFIKLFIDIERERTLTINQLSVNMALSAEVEKKFGFYLPISGGFYKAKEAPEFMWIRHKMTKARQDLELSIMIYTMDYQDTFVFDPRHIIQWRNAMTMEHIPGPSPLSFMKVATEFKPPIFDTIPDFPGGYAIETRGLWEVEHDFMGGVFISYTFIDKAKNKVVTLDGYVYNPNDDKKNFVRQLEAIFFAMKFSPEQ
jgi:hypothetical protein